MSCRLKTQKMSLLPSIPVEPVPAAERDMSCRKAENSFNAVLVVEQLNEEGDYRLTY